MTPETLNAPAYLNEVAVFKVTSKKKSLHIMRFNNGCQGYWLLKTAIQVMLTNYHFMDDAEMQESVQNNGHADYPALTVNAINLQSLAGLIQKK